MAEKVKFANARDSEFYTVLKSRVNQYFVDKGISKYANAEMVIKTIFILSVVVGSWTWLIVGAPNLVVFYLLWAILGVFTAFVGLNICHDAIHGAYSTNATVNKTLGFLFNIAGANAYMWSIMHNIAHHTYTNIEGMDEDIESVPLLRMSPHQKLKKVHRHQYWYAFLLYGFATLSWVFIKDYKKFFQKNIGNYDNKTHPPVEYFNLFFFKAVHYVLYIVIPFVFIEQSFLAILGGFLLMHFFEGLTLAIVFMLAHIVEGLDFPLPDDKGSIENAWAIHQVNTTADFARKNPFANYFCGGLNFQVEHHLFPKICHVHYTKLSEIVKNTCEEFNIPYHESKTFFGAIGSHIRLLKQLGRHESLAKPALQV